MNKIKIISGSSASDLQTKIDKWVDEVHPNIISTSIAKDGSWLSVSITYSTASTAEDLLFS